AEFLQVADRQVEDLQGGPHGGELAAVAGDPAGSCSAPTRSGPTGPACEVYFRLMESPDECFPYSPEDPPTSGRCQISALDLREGVLRQVYADNARRPIPSLAATGEPAAPYRRGGPPRPGRRPLKEMSLAVGAPGGRHSAHGRGADPLRSGNARESIPVEEAWGTYPEGMPSRAPDRPASFARPAPPRHPPPSPPPPTPA